VKSAYVKLSLAACIAGAFAFVPAPPTVSKLYHQQRWFWGSPAFTVILLFLMAVVAVWLAASAFKTLNKRGES